MAMALVAGCVFDGQVMCLAFTHKLRRVFEIAVGVGTLFVYGLACSDSCYKPPHLRILLGLCVVS